MTKKLRRANGSVAVAILVTAGAVGWALKTATLHAQGQTIRCSTAFTAVVAPAGVLPFVPLSSLKAAPNPVLPKDPVTGKATLRGDLADYVANLPAAIQLGKALFWDMQAGSDDKTACATCHFHAGADARTEEPAQSLGRRIVERVHRQLRLRPERLRLPVRPRQHHAGSQGVRKALVQGPDARAAASRRPLSPTRCSTWAAVNVRQVTGVNAPPAINAVFNHRNFYDGRAQAEFNGVNPFGNRDTSARVWHMDAKGKPSPIDVHIQNASLASQAVGPASTPSRCPLPAGRSSTSRQKLYGRQAARPSEVSMPTTACSARGGHHHGQWPEVTYQTLDPDGVPAEVVEHEEDRERQRQELRP